MGRAAVLALAILTFGGCGPGGGGGPTTDGGAAWLEIGGGEWQFEPLTDGQQVELVRGGQGGYHVWVSFRARDLDPEGVEMTITTEIVGREGSRTGTTLVRDLDTVGDETTFGYIGWPAVIPEAACADGQTVEVAVTLVDGHGVWAAGSITVVPVATIDPGTCV